MRRYKMVLHPFISCEFHLEELPFTFHSFMLQFPDFPTVIISSFNYIRIIHTLKMSYTSEESKEESEHFVDFDFIDTGYGKNHVKLLRIKRVGAVHHVKEFQVDTQLTLCSKKDYLFGDNSDIVATDSQKNIVYILAKIHGLKSPEEFGLVLCSHFLSKYPRVNKAKISIEEHPWQRMVTDEVPHNHAFISTPTCSRFACVTCERGAMPDIESGLKDLRVMKTTQSAFEHFIHDEFSTLPDCPERIFSTVIYSKWKYGMTAGLDYDYAWDTVKNSVLYAFAGSPDTGIFSPSVQNTLYLAQKEVLEKIPQMSWIEVQLPNKHYTPVDFSQFKYIGVNHPGSENEVFLPSYYPAGNIRAVLGRKSLLSPDMHTLQSKL